MSGYRIEWECCGDETYTQAWEPEECPFCEVNRLQSEVERLRSRCAELESSLQQFVISGTGPVADEQNKFQSALTLRKQAEAIEDSLSLYDPEWYARTLRNQADELEKANEN